MAVIKCPKCGESFTVDEAGYAAILAQVRTAELEKEANDRAKFLSADKDKEIAKLQMQIEALEESSEKDAELAVAKAIADKEKELNELRLEKQESKAKFEAILSAKDEEISFYKDFKAKESTKMIGENLEQHCMAEFEKIRSAAFKNAYFDKDNDVSESGSKGDFIFRDYDDDGNEYISIMFEMKNEADTTATKHKNKDFLKELDKDRNEKECEYAILVSMLESDSEIYNQGIVDMSHEYEKMYVIRPQFFIPMITILRNAAQNSIEWQQALVEAQNEHVDIDNLEAEITDFKEKFGNNFRLAADHYEKAIDNIDKTIKSLEKTKDELMKSMKNLKWANDKAEDISLFISEKNS